MGPASRLLTAALRQRPAGAKRHASCLPPRYNPRPLPNCRAPVTGGTASPAGKVSAGRRLLPYKEVIVQVVKPPAKSWLMTARAGHYHRYG